MKKTARKQSSDTDMEFVIDVTVEDAWGKSDFDAESLAHKIVPFALNTAQFNEPTEVSILLTDDGAIRLLNKQYRGKDKATNVLSFPMGGEVLGDIVIAFETMMAEAVAMNVPAQDHFTHLLVHGVLHLLGHDHEAEEQAETMENLEISILSSLGVENPYARANFLA